MKKDKLSILVVTAVIVLAIVLILILPVANSIWTAYQSNKVAQSDLHTATLEKQTLDELKKNNQLELLASNAESLIPKDANSGELIIELSNLAEQNNIQLSQTSIDKIKVSATPAPAADESQSAKSPAPNASPTASDDPQTLGFSLQFSGSFGDVLNYLNALDSSSRLISITNLSLKSTASSSTQPDAAPQTTMAASLKGVVYYKQSVTLADTLENIKISDETIAKLKNLKTSTKTAIPNNNSGFGRQNPFEGY